MEEAENATRKLIPDRNRKVAQRLRLTRRALSLAQGKFAVLAGISPAAYNQWESGVTYPPVDAAIRLCEAHGLSLDWIYLGEISHLPYVLAESIKALQAIDAER